MTRSLIFKRFSRLTRFLLLLALVGSAALVCSVTTTHAAQPANICPACPPLPPPGPAISVTANGLGTLTITGKYFTPGGQVQIVASMPPDSMGGGGTTTAMIAASPSFYTCLRPYGCIFHPGGSIATTIHLTFSCGGG